MRNTCNRKDLRFLGFLIMVSIYSSLKGRSFGLQVYHTSDSLGFFKVMQDVHHQQHQGHTPGSSPDLRASCQAISTSSADTEPPNPKR